MGEEQKTSIIGKAEVSKEKMMSWAKNKNNNEEYLFVMDLAWEMAEHLGIRPEVACCQISKETGYLYKNGSADVIHRRMQGIYMMLLSIILVA